MDPATTRCINCSMRLSHQRWRTLQDATHPMMNVLRTWISPTPVSPECKLCLECYNILQQVSNDESVHVPMFGHRSVCFACGISILRAHTHLVHRDCPERNIIMRWMFPHLLFVVAGVSLNMGSTGSVFGFPAILLPQLRAPDSDVPITSSEGTWIASILGFSLLAGNFMVPTLMGKFGRKLASLISCTVTLVCWIWIVLATDVTSLLIARFFQGLSVGINLSLAPIMIGEYTSPSNRGLFSSVMTSTITAQTLLVHVLGSYVTWRTTALVLAFISCAGVAILIFSPESPSWLADRGKYKDSAKAYKWLRGDGEDEELEKMFEARKTRGVIASSMTYRDDVRSFIDFIRRAFSKKEFYNPVVIMIHLYTLCMWTGMVLLIVYVVDTLSIVVGKEVDVAFHVTVLDIQRMVATVCASSIIKKVKRRTILFSTLGINLAALVALGAYTFAKTKYTLPFDHPAIGIILLHIHMFSVTTGALPLPIIISGELFPLEFRSLAGGISGIAFSVNYFIASKTVFFLISAVGIYGAYTLYAVITVYCMVVVWILLPETKDRTLQQIEEDFRRKDPKSPEELAASLPLTSERSKVDEVP